MYSLTEVDSVPPEIGVYAWYACPSIGAADWLKATDPATEDDLGTERLHNLLIAYTRKLDPSSFWIEARSSFQYTWRGQLNPSLMTEYDTTFVSPRETAESSDVPKGERDRARKIWKSLQTQKRRGALTELITKSNPDLSSPIYIGKSKNMRDRVTTHAKTFRKYSDALSAEPHRRDEMLEYIRSSDKNFGARAAALNFSADELFVVPCTIKENVSASLNEAEQEQIAESFEWLLNRWFRPICGRL